MRTRTGKIARLPEPIREELNQRLFNGARGKDMPAWLNELPEVRQTLAEFFNGRPITEHNVSEWRTGGFQDWLRQEETNDRLRQVASQYEELGAEGKDLLDARVRGIMTVELAEALDQLDRMKPDARWKRFQKISWELCRLQKAHTLNRELRLRQEKSIRAG